MLEFSLAIEKDTEKAKSLPSAFSASAELAVIGPTLSDAHTDVDRRASKRQARELFSNAVPFGLWCGDSATEPLLVMCTSYVVYRDDRADWSDRVARTARESRKSLRYHGVSYGANIHHLLIVVQPVVDSIGKAHMAYNVRKQPLAQSLSDILCLYENSSHTYTACIDTRDSSPADVGSQVQTPDSTPNVPLHGDGRCFGRAPFTLHANLSVSSTRGRRRVSNEVR